MTRTYLAAALALALAGPVAAADFSDPTWPCIQRKVERLSIGLMWPMDPDAPAPDLSGDREHDVELLAETLSLRRVDLADAEARVAAFTAEHGGDRALLAEVFARVFDRLSQRRSRVMDGIAEFSLSQIALSERIDAARTEMDALMAAETPDFDRADEIEERLAWDERIYTDRQKTLTYVCETPVLLEKRLFSIAQLLQGAAES